MTASTLAKIRTKLANAGFKSITRDPGPTGRAARLIVDGVVVEVKSAIRGATGKRLWMFNLHRRGVLDESEVGAYIFHLAAAPDFLDFYLVFAAPIGRATIAFSPSTVARQYSARIEDWNTIKMLVKNPGAPFRSLDSGMWGNEQPARPLAIGVLALQGAYDAHAAVLTALHATPKLVRNAAELEDLDGLIIPGGESTTFLKFLERDGFLDALTLFVQQKPTFGTCAGAILLATEVTNSTQRSLNALDITVERNYYGRQNDSIILTEPTSLPGGPLEMVYIRAPRIARTGPGVETLATRSGDPVLVRSGHLLAATFHPELSSDLRVHSLFLDMVRSYGS